MVCHQIKKVIFIVCHQIKKAIFIVCRRIKSNFQGLDYYRNISYPFLITSKTTSWVEAFRS